MRRLIILAALCVGCSHGTAVDLTVQLGGDLVGRGSEITALQLMVDGDSTAFDKTVPLVNRFKNGKETLQYLPGRSSGTLTFTVTLSNAAGTLGSGSVMVQLHSNSSVSATIVVGAGSGDMGVGSDLSSADLTPVILPPRPMSPQNFSGVTTLRPTLKWELPTGTDGAHIELCSDAKCNTVLQTLDAIGTSTTPPTNLPGVNTKIFWRMTGRSSGKLGTLRSPTWIFSTPYSGTSVDTSYGITLDLNGDGYDDLAVGAPLFNSNAGLVFVYYGSSTGLDLQPSPAPLTEPGGGGSNFYFGGGVAAAGDVDGDGYGDLIVSANQNGSPGAGPGHAYVFFGSPTGLSTTRTPVTLSIPAMYMTNANGNSPAFGGAVASAGDVDGDGYADVIVGAPFNVQTTPAPGAFVFRGGPNGPSSTPSSQIVGPTGSVYFGNSVAEAGDVNGDGYSDVIVGGYAGGGTGQDGFACVYHGTPGGLGSTPPVASTFEGATNDGAGISVAGGGDFNNDGYADVAVGAQGNQKAYIFVGSSGGLGTTPTIYKTLPTANCEYSVCPTVAAGNNFAFSLAVARSFVVIGAPCAQRTTVCGPGEASVWSDLTLTNANAVQLAFSGSNGDNFGVSMIVGDYNGDGFSDVVIGAPNTSSGKGAIYVYPGYSGTGYINGASASPFTDGVYGGYFGSL
jgi:hypothetical protein